MHADLFSKVSMHCLTSLKNTHIYVQKLIFIDNYFFISIKIQLYNSIVLVTVLVTLHKTSVNVCLWGTFLSTFREEKDSEGKPFEMIREIGTCISCWICLLIDPYWSLKTGGEF